MKFSKNIFLLGLMAMLFFMACRKDVIVDTPTVNPPAPPVVNVEGGVIGLVLDENSNPVSGALIELNGHQFQTDSIGVFFFNHIDLNEAGALVTVDKSGYFKGSRRFYPSLGNKNYVEIKLLPKIQVGPLDANIGGEVETTDGAKIELPAGGIIDENGNTYTGEVIVFAHRLNPVAEDIHQIMPGSLEGKNAEGTNVALETYGMLAVELETPSGQPLNLGNDKKAKLTFPVPSELQGAAPAEIPLWYFDEKEGLWIEEEKATFDGNNYVGEVGHFSFWNCDDPFPLIELSGCFVGEDGLPLANKKVKITNLTTGNCGYGMTDDNGCFKGKVPQNEPLKIELQSNCLVPFYIDDIGAFSQSTDLGTLQATDYVDQFFTSTMKGRVVDCDGVVLDEVVLEIDAGGERSHYVVDGAGFEISVEHCVNLASLSMRVRFVENQTSIVSLPIEVFTDSLTQIIGDLAVCKNDDIYVKISMKGESFTYYTAPPSIAAANLLAPPNNSSTAVLFKSFLPQDSSYCLNSSKFIDWKLGDSFVSDDTNGSFSFIFANLTGAFQFQEKIFMVNDEVNNPEVKMTIDRLDGVGGYVKGTYEFKGIYTEGRYYRGGIGAVSANADRFPVDVLVEFSLPRTN